MTEATGIKWQFSLRSLLLFMVACAVLAGIGKTVDTSIFVGVVFVLLSVLPAIRLKGHPLGSYLVSFFTIYGPFVVMATYTLLYVSCSHCKQAAWEFLPYAPGVIPVELGRHLLDLPRFSGPLEIGLAALVSAGMVVGLTWAVCKGRLWWKAFCVTGGLLLCAYMAFIVFAIIRA
ncbi:MAG: hypothetical protein WD669_10150 [Pirellulales bacterium]